MNASCDLQAVLVSSDTGLLDSISSSLSTLGISSQVYQQPASAMQMLNKQKADAFFVDRELDPEFSVLRSMRTSRSSRTAVGFAIIPRDSSANEAFRVADFVMDKPLAHPRMNRALRAAYGIMLKERMRYSRHNLRTEATLIDSTNRKFTAQTSNISQTGIALECAAPLIAQETVQLQFSLPTNASISCKAQIIWTADQSKAGLTFVHMTSADKEQLNAWIEAEFQRQWPPLDPSGTIARSNHATA
jgi:DNA-binding response OmpR family regulator